MKKLLIFTGIVSVLFACSKEQFKVNRLEGNWNLDKVEVKEGSNTLTASEPNGSLNFDKCKLKEEDFCTYTISSSYEYGQFEVTESDAGEYRVQDDQIQTREDADDNEYDTYDIETLKRKELVLVQNTDDGYTKLYYSK